VNRRTSQKVTTYAVLVSVALVAAIVLAQPDVAALGAPFAMALVAGLATSRRAPPGLSADVSLSEREIGEGDRVHLTVEIRSQDVDGRCDVGIRLPPALAVVEGAATQPLTLRSGATAEVTLTVVARRWGSFVVGPVAARVREPGGLHTWEGTIGGRELLRVRPLRMPTRAVVHPFRPGAAAGEHTSRARADGIEFADMRPYVHGDRMGRVNWRASAKRGEIVVNDRHPERGADVVLFIDTFVDRGLADTVRIASSLADTYLRRHDRVGLISFGGLMSWIEPGGGARQRERLDEALLGSESFASYAWKSLETIPPRMLPARCLVLAVSPLVDERTLGALAAMATRRLDLAVLEVPLEVSDEFRSTWSGGVTMRLHEMRHGNVRDRFLSMGVAVVRWDPAGGVEAAIREIDEYRRRARVRVRS
jgi:uncharacterized protein (DUF58 family)